MYQIKIKGEVIKEYKYKLQAYTWCLLHGYVLGGKGYYYLRKECEIVEIN